MVDWGVAIVSPGGLYFGTNLENVVVAWEGVSVVLPSQ